MIPKLTRYPSWIYLVSVMFVAFLLRVPLLSGSFWLDEAAQALESSRPLSQQLLIRDDFQPPLLHYVIHFALYFGNSESWLRTIGALIPGLATIFFTYKIGFILGGKRLAVLSSLLLATSSFHIFYSQELRQYSLPAAFAVGGWYLLLLNAKEKTKPSIKRLSLFALLTAAGLYSSYLYPFALIGQGVWVLSQKRFIWHWGGAAAAAFLAFVPWLPSFFDQLSAGTELQSSLPGWATVVSPTQDRALLLTALKFIFGVQDVELSPYFLAASALIGSCLLLLAKNRELYRKHVPLLKPIIIWGVVPMLSAWIISFWVPVLQPKRVLFCLPAFYLGISALTLIPLATLKSLSFKSAPVIFFLTFVVINLISTVQYWTTPALQRENWRSLVQTIETNFPERSVTLFAFPKPFAPWQWYSSPSYPSLATQELLLSDDQALATVKRATNYDHVLLFDYLRDLSDPERKLDRLLIEYGYKETGLLEYPSIGFVRIYSKPTAVISYN